MWAVYTHIPIIYASRAGTTFLWPITDGIWSTSRHCRCQPIVAMDGRVAMCVVATNATKYIVIMIVNIMPRFLATATVNPSIATDNVECINAYSTEILMEWNALSHSLIGSMIWIYIYSMIAGTELDEVESCAISPYISAGDESFMNNIAMTRAWQGNLCVPHPTERPITSVIVVCMYAEKAPKIRKIPYNRSNEKC